MTTTATATRTGDLVLARLLVAGKRLARKKLRDDVSRLHRHPPGGERWDELMHELVEAGFVTAKPLSLTDAGRARALEFLGLSELPARASWKTIKDRYLVPLALGVADGDARKKLGKGGGLAAAVLRRYNLPATATLNQTLESLACQQLGFPGETSLRRVADLALTRLLRDGDEPLKRKDLEKQLPTAAVRAARGGAGAMREAILRDWADGERPAPAAREEAFDLAAFAATVRAAARDCPTGRFGDNKVFIAHVWARLLPEPSFPVRTLAEFKARLVEANRADLLTLSRADLVEAMDPADVRESETGYLGTTFHFVLLERGRP